MYLLNPYGSEQLRMEVHDARGSPMEASIRSASPRADGPHLRKWSSPSWQPHPQAELTSVPEAPGTPFSTVPDTGTLGWRGTPSTTTPLKLLNPSARTPGPCCGQHWNSTSPQTRTRHGFLSTSTPKSHNRACKQALVLVFCLLHERRFLSPFCLGL